MVTRSTSLLAVLAGAVAVALAIIAGPGCSIDSRSDAYACDPGCPSDRVCVDGWCIARDAGAPIDGRTADAAVVRQLLRLGYLELFQRGDDRAIASTPRTTATARPIVDRRRDALEILEVGISAGSLPVELIPRRVLTPRDGLLSNVVSSSSSSVGLSYPTSCPGPTCTAV